jgi:hypothetical protein
VAGESGGVLEGTLGTLDADIVSNLEQG